MKTHFDNDGHSACGRGKRSTSNVNSVDCLVCKKQTTFLNAYVKMQTAKAAAFNNQIPRVVREPWRDGNIECRECGHEFFRHGDRTCYGHYDNFVCANCGHVESRLTEIGMSF